jgi:hypothetical protein
MTHVYVNSLIRVMLYAEGHGFSLALFTAAHDSLITRSRNALLKSFLDATAATHLMFIDADIGFEPEAVHRLLSFDEEVVAGMYPVKAVDWARMGASSRSGMSGDELRLSGLHFVGSPCPIGERQDRDGFVTGKYAGTGFMMIKRRAVERLIEAYPETAYRQMHTYPRPAAPTTPFYNLFDCMIEPESGVYLSEDYAFCHRFREIGGTVWLDTRSRLRHVGSMEFSGCASMEATPVVAVAPGNDEQAIAAE